MMTEDLKGALNKSIAVEIEKLKADICTLEKLKNDIYIPEKEDWSRDINIRRNSRGNCSLVNISNQKSVFSLLIKEKRDSISKLEREIYDLHNLLKEVK